MSLIHCAAPGAALAAALLVSASLQAQTAPAPSAAANASTAPAQPAATEAPIQLGEYVVNAYSQSLEASLNAKRSSNEDTEVITSETTGQYPDLNLAESLSHLPGVTTDNLFGEGERVSILGADPNLNRVLFNGEDISTADWYVLDNQSRQFDYLLIAPEVVGQATVYLSPEAKLVEGSIGGTVVVNTRDPMALAPGTFQGSVTDQYNDRADRNDANESGFFSWHNAQNTFGFLIGGEDERDYVDRQGVEALSLQTQNNFSVAGPPGGGAYGNWATYGQPAGNWVTDEVVNSVLFLQERQRDGVNGTVVLQPNDNLRVDLSGLWVRESMNNVNFSWYIYPGDDWSGLTYLSNAHVDNGVLDNYTVNNAPLVVDAFNRAAVINTQWENAKIVYKTDSLVATANVGYTRATGGTQHQFFAENFIFASANVNESANQASFSVTSPASGVNNGADFATDGAGNFYGNIASNPEVDDYKWAQLDLDDKLSGVLTDIETGLRFSDHHAGQTGDVVSVPNAGSVNTSLASIGVTQMAPSNFLSGLPGVTPSMSQHLEPTGYGGVANFVANLPAAGLTGATPGETLLQYFDSQPPSDAAVFTATPSFTIDERVTAGYLQADFANAGALSGNVGLRFVETTVTSSSYDLSTPSAPTLQTTESTVDNVLPAANLVYDLGNNQQLRFDAAEVISRPNTSSEANWVELYDSSRSGVGGNADLKNYESTNFDIAYEDYFGKNSYFEIDPFYRDISNYIVNATNPESWIDYSLPGTPTESYEITRPTNGGAATSEGVLLAYQQELANGLGLQANYTWLHTSTQAGGPLPFSSKDEINLSPYFEDRFGLIRLTYAWRNDYLSNSFNGTQSIYTAPYTEIDADLQINVTKNLEIELWGRNLGDSTYRQYFLTQSGVQDFADAYKFGRTYQAGIHWNF